MKLNQLQVHHCRSGQLSSPWPMLFPTAESAVDCAQYFLAHDASGISSWAILQSRVDDWQHQHLDTFRCHTQLDALLALLCLFLGETSYIYATMNVIISGEFQGIKLDRTIQEVIMKPKACSPVTSWSCPTCPGNSRWRCHGKTSPWPWPKRRGHDLSDLGHRGKGIQRCRWS